MLPPGGRGHGMAQPRDSKGRWTSGGGTTLGALALAVAVAAGTGAVGTSAVGGGGARAGSSNSAKARDRDPLPVLRRLERRGLQVEQRLDASGSDCAAHSYGAVRDWFRDHPCEALFRAVYEVRDSRRTVVLVAVAWVDMPDEASARELRTLVDGDGTGNVTELSREQGRHRDVRFTGEHYESARDGVTVVNAQAQPVGRAAAAAELAGMVTAALG